MRYNRVKNDGTYVPILVNLLADIQDALGTEEHGEALVEVARNAHKAEMELASMYNQKEDMTEGIKMLDKASKE